MSKLWGGRFAKSTDALVHEFNASLSFDTRLAAQDVAGSKAWAQGLADAGVLTKAEAETLIAGLEQVRLELANGRFPFEPSDEDIHTAVERRLTEIVGAVGGKLHTGRSRNDQVATDFRLWLLDACQQIADMLTHLQESIIASAEANLNLPMPGYTHLQHAQPITWGHWILSHFWPLVRDQARLAQAKQQTAVLPLGSGALAGTAFPINRQALAEELGFAAISQNSLDGVSDRDFAADFLYAAAMIGVHLSRLSEQLILFSSREFAFVRLDDGYSTGSSLMPQKKNPDTLELTRGKCGRLLGNLISLLTTLKGLPSGYDKDLQEDKEPVFDAFDTLSRAIPVMAGLIRTLTLRPEKMAQQLDPNLLATDLADYLVMQGVPFRQAHHLVGKVVQLAEDQGVALTSLTLTDLRSVSKHFGVEATAVFDVRASLSARDVSGGTSPRAMQNQLKAAKKALSGQKV